MLGYVLIVVVDKFIRISLHKFVIVKQSGALRSVLSGGGAV